MGFLDTVKSKATDLKAKVDSKMAGAHIEHTAWGQLVKAWICIWDTQEKAFEGQEPGKKLEFMFNPASVKYTRSMRLEKGQAQNHGDEQQFKGSNPIKIEIGDIWFDTYETRSNVRDRIRPLENLMVYKKDTHISPVVRFVWGDFAKQDSDLVFFVESLAVDYCMFLPDGTPVRAKISLSLTQAFPVDKQEESASQESPDHAKLYTVRRGDTLQSIALAEYEDPREWRRIAVTNAIDDPMSLRPGTKLLVPPILK